MTGEAVFRAWDIIRMLHMRIIAIIMLLLREVNCITGAAPFIGMYKVEFSGRELSREGQPQPVDLVILAEKTEISNPSLCRISYYFIYVFM